MSPSTFTLKQDPSVKVLHVSDTECEFFSVPVPPEYLDGHKEKVWIPITTITRMQNETSLNFNVEPQPQTTEPGGIYMTLDDNPTKITMSHDRIVFSGAEITAKDMGMRVVEAYSYLREFLSIYMVAYKKSLEST